MQEFSETAENIADRYSSELGPETRNLAADIDEALAQERQKMDEAWREFSARVYTTK